MAADASETRGYRFAGFRLESSKHRLVDASGIALPLSGRAYDVLAYLVEHRGRVVGKDELLKAVWPNVVVEENNLNQAISTLRRTLGDSRESPRFIVTVAGRGYRFIGDAAPLAADEAGAPTDSPAALPAPADAFAAKREAATAAAQVPAPSRRALLAAAAAAVAAATVAGVWWSRSARERRPPGSVAVLPFKPLLADASNPAIELGITELLINRLGRVPGLVVTPLTSVMREGAAGTDPLAAGRKLGVESVVEGHVQMQDGRVRVSARLLAVDGGRSLWANAFTEPLGELLAVQDSLAVQIARALTLELPENARALVVAQDTADPEAWQLYASGRFQVERRDVASIRRAIEFFEAALRRDPRFALAAAGLSDAHALTAVFGVEPTGRAWEKARQAAAQAIALDPRLPSAHVALAHAATQFDRDLEAGRRHYEQALKLDPRHAWAMAYMALNRTQKGDLAAAADHIRRAQLLEPAAFAFIAISGWVRYFERAFDDAERHLSRLVDNAPGAALPRQFLAHVMLARGQGTKVVSLLEGRNDPSPVTFSNLGRAYAQAGDGDGARRELRQLESLAKQGFGVGFAVALIELDLGERERALDALERGVDDHSQMQGYLNVEPALDPIRDDPRFRAVAQRLRLA